MEFRVLGPVEARRTDHQLEVGHAKQRAVLAVLVLELNQVVPVERLIDRVWGDDPPASVRNVLYGYVAKLKSALACAGEPGAALVRRSGGYVLQASEDTVDLCRFRRLVDDAGLADDEHAASLLRDALGLWHGEALAGLASPWLDAMRQTLEVQRVAAQLDLNDIALRQGQHQTLLSELAEQATTHPADERLTGQLMLALYRCGRQAEALNTYERTRQRLAHDLGADPCPQLQTLHQQILRSDPAITTTGPGAIAPPPVRLVPRELPRDVIAFAGRGAELAELNRLLPAPGSSGDTQQATPPIVVLAISGTAGVGKTALAVHWAHQVTAHFPDGQLYVNLRGYDPAIPMTASDALAGFLRALGVDPQDIPADVERRAARYRSLLAGRQVLVVLDNASDAEQVRPLLPGASGCLVVVTSRDSLPGLVARDGARRIDLDLLPLAEAVGLLRLLLGDRVDADHAAAAALADHCGRLPLALRVTAELAAVHRTVPLRELATELADHQRRLDLLDAGGDPRAAVRTVFSWSYQKLDDATARAFRVIGLHPGADFDPYAAAALASTSPESAGQVLTTLSRAYLVQHTSPGRFGLHDLLRAYARDLARKQDSKRDRRAAQTRLFGYYRHTASLAMKTLYPWRRHQPAVSLTTPAPAVADVSSARAWLDAERANMADVVAYMTDNGWPHGAARFAGGLWQYLDTGGYFPDAAKMHGCALRAARLTGDRQAEANALNHLGVLDLQQGRHEPAIRQLQASLALFRDLGDRAGEARTLNNLSVIDHRQGRYSEAMSQLQRALELFRDLDDRNNQARALLNLGIAETEQEHYEAAASHEHEALALFRAAKDLASTGETISRLGVIELRQGHYREATDRFEHALVLAEQAGDRDGQAKAFNGLGEVLLATGDPAQARTHLTAARDMASHAGYHDQEARAHHGLARACEAIGEAASARRHGQEAFALYSLLGSPEAERVRAHLGTLGIRVADTSPTAAGW